MASVCRYSEYKKTASSEHLSMALRTSCGTHATSVGKEKADAGDAGEYLPFLEDASANEGIFTSHDILRATTDVGENEGITLSVDEKSATTDAETRHTNTRFSFYYDPDDTQIHLPFDSSDSVESKNTLKGRKKHSRIGRFFTRLLCVSRRSKRKPPKFDGRFDDTKEYRSVPLLSTIPESSDEHRRAECSPTLQVHSIPLISDVRTQPEYKDGGAAKQPNPTEVSSDPKVESTVEANCADPTMEIPVESTRPVGHSSSSAVPDADAIEALPTVLTSKSHDAADKLPSNETKEESDTVVKTPCDALRPEVNDNGTIRDKLPSNETKKESETVVKTPCDELRPEVNDNGTIRDTEDFPTIGSLDMINRNDHLENIEQLSLQEQEHVTDANYGHAPSAPTVKTDESYGAQTSMQKKNFETTPVDDAGADCLGRRSSITDVEYIEHADEESNVNHESQECSYTLPLKMMLEINKLKDEHRDFSYYMLRNTKLVIHAEDGQTDEDLHRLKIEMTRILKDHCPPEGIVITSKSCQASLCGNGVGELVVVDGHCQTVGLYLQYKGKKYFASSGHLLAGATPDGDGAVEVKMFPQADLPGAVVSSGTESVSVALHCFNYNPLPNTRGQLLMNHVDIMICEMPPLIDDDPGPRSLNEVRDRCKICFAHRCRYEREVVYVATEIMYFNDVEVCSQPGNPTVFVVHSAEQLVQRKQQLMCYPCRQEFVVGAVIGCKNALGIKDNGTKGCFNNVLLIKPLGRAVPVRGNSGSVWVKKDSREAVAITCGMAEVKVDGQDVSVWLAALLHPCLDAFCEKYKRWFRSLEDFEVLA